MAKYDSWPTERRYAEAIRLHTEEGISLRRAAQLLSISRPRLGTAFREHKAKLAEQQARSELARLDQMGPERRAEARPLVVQNEVRRVPPIGEFVRMYFDGLKCPRHNVHHEIPPYQDEIMAKIVDRDLKRLMVHVPPGHSKSTCGTVFTSVHEICSNPNTQIGIMSASTRMANRFLRQIRQYLVDPIHYRDSSHNLIADWGPFVDARGNLGRENEFYIAGRQSIEKEPTVSAYGLGQQIQGTRFDRFICDDIALLENQKNPDRIQDMLLLVTQDIQTRLDETGELVIIGTRVLPGDVYSFLKEFPEYQVIRYPCILDEFEEKVLWPEHFDYAAAVRQRGSMSSEQFELVYQNSELAGLGASFTPEQLHRCHDVDRNLGDVPANCALVAGLDPAGANAQAGYTAMVLMGVDVTSGVYHLIDMVNHKQMKAPQVLEQIKDWANRYPLRELRVETNGLQAQLYQYNTELQVYLGNKNVRLAPHITHGRNKWDPQFGVEAMAPLVHNQVMSIPWGNIWSRRQFQQLEDQLVRFPAGKPDDLVMAMWIAWLGCREIWQRQAAPKFDNRKHLPARIRNRRRVVQFGGGVRKLTNEEAGIEINGYSQSRNFMLMNVEGVAQR